MEDVYSKFKEALCPQGEVMHLPGSISQKPSIYVRSCYELLFDYILDLASLGIIFIHISGNPGIGKSCFLWYVLVKLLNEQNGTAVILELMEKLVSRTYVFTPQGTVEKAASPEASPYYEQVGTWLLTDQKYRGSNTRRGVTVLFASPKVENWDEARRVVKENKFKRLYMRPWLVDELQDLFFSENRREPRFYREFWVRYYIAGPIARWYFTPLQDVFTELSQAITHVVRIGAVDATLFHGTMDNGLYSHKVFCFWPSHDCTRVSEYTFLSEWAELCFALACSQGLIANWTNHLEKLTGDPQLRSAAGALFERYAHYRLSKGGTFPSIDNPEIKLVLARRRVRFFDGNSLPLEQIRDLHEFYLRPNSSSFPLIDSVYPPNVMFQVSSLAKNRKAMKKSAFEKLCTDLSAYGLARPEAASGVDGIPNTQPWIVLVKLRGDNSTQSEGLSLVEEVEDTGSAPVATYCKRRRCASSVKQVTQALPVATRKPKKKKMLVKFQATIVLGEDETAPVDYVVLLSDVYHTVRSRMVGDDDPRHLQLKDYTSYDLDGDGDKFVRLVMRRGYCERQYLEFVKDKCVFGVWMEAVRSVDEDKADGLAVPRYTTAVTMECTVGTFLDEDREFEVFIDERVGVELQYDDPVELHVAPGVDAAAGSSIDHVTASLVSETQANVTIISVTRECKYFRLSVHRSQG